MGKGNQKPSRPKINNYNPYNKLELNKFHQLGGKVHNSQSKLLHKKKRDLERAIKFKEEKGEEIAAQKIEELESVKEKLSGNRKNYQKNMRKEFFLKNKYKQIMEIEMRKINKKIHALKSSEMTSQSRKQLLEWEKKQRYIKFFPKNLKYVSLFPSSGTLEEKAIEFQQKIIEDIEKENRRRLDWKNEYKSENVASEKVKKEDPFFISEE